MDLAAILADVQLAVSLGKLAIQVGEDAAPYVERAYQILFEQKTLTDEERQSIKDQENSWRTNIDAAITKDDAGG